MSKKFINNILSKIKGDKDNELAEANYEQASLAIKSASMQVEVDLSDARTSLKSNEKKLEAAKYPVTALAHTDSGRTGYIQSIMNAKLRVEESKEKIQDLEKWQKDLKELQAEIEAEETQG